jgi:hypothetical protein
LIDYKSGDYLSIKSYLIKKLIDFDLIPKSLRWKKSATGLGTIYSDLYTMLINEHDIQGIKKMNNVMYNIGLKQGPEILKELDLERNLEGCAYVLLTMHRIVGMKSKIVEKNDKKIIIHVSHCSWGNHIAGWTPGTCNSIAHSETGLVMGILPDALHQYTKKRSLGNEVCELIISMN